jgi:hypothetical protein
MCLCVCVYVCACVYTLNQYKKLKLKLNTYKTMQTPFLKTHRRNTDALDVKLL